MRRFLVLLCLLGAVAKPPLMRAVSYGPVPLKTQGNGMMQDDWMVQAAKPMWGKRGRDDLQIMKALGADTVRLYGNNPQESHVGFLDEAYRVGLKVVPGMSDFPYIQMTPGKCIDTNYDCFNQSRDSYAMNLETGFLTDSQEYHPALSYFILVNEPDLKLPGTATTSADGPKLMARAVVSALDGLLEAERLANVTGVLINLTATFSYAVCSACSELSWLPALGQMQTLVDAMSFPELYGYVPKNNVTEAFWQRWVHSFNTNNPARDLKAQFFEHYPQHFGDIPVFVAEFHSPILHYLGLTLQEDLQEALEMVNSSDLFFGISFFQYQVAYWKGGSEMDFGLFGLGNYLVAEMPYYGDTFKIWCLEPRVSHATPGSTLPQVLTAAYEGKGLDYDYLCQPNPNVVPLTADGYSEIKAQNQSRRLASFIRRVVVHLGATVVNATAMEQFAAAEEERPEASFGDLVTAISYRPSWTSFSPAAACVADRDASAGQVGEAIAWLCGHSPGFSCDVPDGCTEDAFSTGDWLFSRWYREFGSDPLHDCNFGGAALFASPEVQVAACPVRSSEVLV